MGKTKKEKKLKSGYAYNLTCALLMLVASIVLIVFGFILWLNIGDLNNQSNAFIMGYGAYMALGISFLLIWFARLSKKYVWANNIFIHIELVSLISCVAGLFSGISSPTFTTVSYVICIICPILFVLSIVLLIGAFFGRKYTIPLRNARREERKRLKAEKLAAKNERKALKNEETMQKRIMAEQATQNQSDSIMPDTFSNIMSEQASKKRSIISWISFGVVIAYYVFLTTMGILGIALPDKCILWGPYDDPFYTYSMNYLSGFVCLLFVPSVCYYLAFRGPFRFKRLVNLILVGSGIGVSVIGLILYMSLLNEYFVFTGISMIIAPILSVVGLILVYVIGFLRINPQKLNKIDTNGASLPKKIGLQFVNFGKAILRSRNSPWYYLIGTMLFTICIFILIELLYVFISLAIVLAVIAVVMSLYYETPHSSYNISTNGTSRDLTYDTYDGFRGEQVYKDQYGDSWATKDGGKTFYQVSSPTFVNRKEDDKHESKIQN